MSLKKLLLVALLAVIALPAASKPASAACNAWGYQVVYWCSPADVSTCNWTCDGFCNGTCPPNGGCVTGQWCEYGGERCYCMCEDPCPCEGGSCT